MRSHVYSKIARTGLIVLLGTALMLPAWMAVGPAGFAQSNASEGQSVPAVDAQMLLDAQRNAQNWLLNGHDYTNQRYSALDQITPGNIAQLTPRSIIHTGVHGPIEASPIVVGGVMFLTTAYSHVIAVDLASGTILWRYDPQLGPFVICCGPVNRGVAVVNGKVFLARLDAKLVALDAQTGRVLWMKTLGDWHQGYSETMAPTVIGDAVFVGSSGNEYGVRGFVAAFSQRDGRELWRWWATNPGWEGSWSATTPEGDNLHRDIAHEKALLRKYPNAWKTGGGAVWNTPAVDPKRHLMFFGTGNPAPMNDGSVRPGDNLYTDSIVALDYRNGKMAWYYQYMPHDLWDYDASSPVVLFELAQGGQTIPVLSQAGKDGFVYILDRRSGHRITRSPLIVPRLNQFATPTPKGVLIAPYASGGVNMSPTAYSPQTGYLYALGIDAPRFDVVHPGAKRNPPQTWLGSNAPYPNEWPTGRSGNVTAVDTRTGQIVWQTKTPQPMIGGAVVTATGLVFAGEGNGFVDAFDAKTGKLLWHFKTPAGANGAPIVYEVGGREYVTIGVGGNYTRHFTYGDAFYTFGIPQPGEAGPIMIGHPPVQAAAPALQGLTAGTFSVVAGGPKWMQVDESRKIVRVDINAAEVAKSTPFNFNGFSEGKLSITVPKGWLVQMAFINDGDIPHSLEVAKAGSQIPIQGEPPAFAGATTPELDAGLASHQSAAFQFRAGTAGRFRILCGVPGHAISGMWDYFIVSATATRPGIAIH